MNNVRHHMVPDVGVKKNILSCNFIALPATNRM